MLGSHGESSYFFAEGKSVEVRVELECEKDSKDPCCECEKRKNCLDCRNENLGPEECFWDKIKKICRVKGWLDFNFGMELSNY